MFHLVGTRKCEDSVQRIGCSILRMVSVSEKVDVRRVAYMYAISIEGRVIVDEALRLFFFLSWSVGEFVMEIVLTLCESFEHRGSQLVESKMFANKKMVGLTLSLSIRYVQVLVNREYMLYEVPLVLYPSLATLEVDACRLGTGVSKVQHLRECPIFSSLVDDVLESRATEGERTMGWATTTSLEVGMQVVVVERAYKGVAM